MSRSLDVLERAIHGSPAGYAAGCRSKGGCPNHGSRRELTCVEAVRAHRHYYDLARLDETTIVTRAMRTEARTRPFRTEQT